MDKIEIKRIVLEGVKTTIESPSKRKKIWVEEILYSDGTVGYEIRKEIIEKDDPRNNNIH